MRELFQQITNPILITNPIVEGGENILVVKGTSNLLWNFQQI
jgi:hypothetical protein